MVVACNPVALPPAIEFHAFGVNTTRSEISMKTDHNRPIKASFLASGLMAGRLKHARGVRAYSAGFSATKFTNLST
jgi:hypothetical protein